MSYRSELVQVAASALVAAQIDEVGTTSLLPGDAEGLRGRWSLEHLLDEVRKERHTQEIKWGVRHSEDARFWLLVLLEEVGEVAEEIKDGALVAEAIALGNRARALLELR